MIALLAMIACGTAAPDSGPVAPPAAGDPCTETSTETFERGLDEEFWRWALPLSGTSRTVSVQGDRVTVSITSRAPGCVP